MYPLPISTIILSLELGPELPPEGPLLQSLLTQFPECLQSFDCFFKTLGVLIASLQP